MVRGLGIFKDHFKGYEDHYILIGGVACDLAMSAVDESFRATKDIDIVLCLESLSPDFVTLFWDFVGEGGYENRQKSTGRSLFYRFHTPKDENDPYTLELFPRTTNALNDAGKGHLIPIPMGEEASSLSAILLDEEYYAFIHEGKTQIDGVPIVRAEYNIPLKARAWLDLAGRRGSGERVDEKSIRKHRNDVFRLYRILVPDDTPELTGQVAEDMSSFITGISGDTIGLKSFGYESGVSKNAILEGLKEVYGIGGYI